MPQLLSRKQPLLALSWDQQQLVWVLAQSAGNKILVRAANTVSRQTEDGEVLPLAELLRGELQEHGIKRATVLVGLARSQVEMRDMTLPPAQDPELPELVRNQALQQYADVTDECVIDFVMLDDDPTQPRHVAAAIASAELLKYIQQQITATAHAPACIALRPFSAASLCCRMVGSVMGKCLLVSRLEHEADFSIIFRRKVIFSRTIRFGTDASPEDIAQQVIAEIKRSILVAPQSSPEEGPVEHVYVFGAIQEQEATLRQLADELDLPVSLLNPLEGFELRKEAISGNMHHRAGLLGMIRDQVDGRHAIDFVHPKLPPPPVNHRRRAALYAAVAVVAVGSVGFHFAGQIQQARSDVSAWPSSCARPSASCRRSTRRRPSWMPSPVGRPIMSTGWMNCRTSPHASPPGAMPWSSGCPSPRQPAAASSICRSTCVIHR